MWVMKDENGRLKVRLVTVSFQINWRRFFLDIWRIGGGTAPIIRSQK
jgi:hypothetical protein